MCIYKAYTYKYISTRTCQPLKYSSSSSFEAEMKVHLHHKDSSGVKCQIQLPDASLTTRFGTQAPAERLLFNLRAEAHRLWPTLCWGMAFVGQTPSPCCTHHGLPLQRQETAIGRNFENLHSKRTQVLIFSHSPGCCSHLLLCKLTVRHSNLL